jgi:hypothetical protein
VTPIIYRSTDSSAPVLTGEVGSLIALLDACLVDGYGSKSAAGWTKAYSGTNKAAYRMSTAGSALGFYMRIEDNAPSSPGAGVANEATCHGYVSMTDVDTGDNPFPVAADVSMIRKSATANSTARNWVVAADDRTVYIITMPGDTTGRYISLLFGEFYSFKTSTDDYRAFIAARRTANSNAVTVFGDASAAGYDAPLLGWWLARNAAGSGATISCAQPTGLPSSGARPPFPNNVDSLAYVERRLLTNGLTTPGVRGFMRGIYDLHNGGAGVADGDTFSGTGDFAGRDFQVIKPVGGSATRAYAIETTDWDVNG